MSFLLRMCMRTASELAGLVTLLAVDRDGGGIVTAENDPLDDALVLR